MPKSCCAVGCSNHNMKEKKLSFHIFPMDPERRSKWVNAVKRVEPDGSEWRPTKTTVLCGEHFLSGRPSKDPTHPDFIPSIFKHTQADPKSSESKLQRFAAAERRTFFIPTQIPSKKRVLQDNVHTLPAVQDSIHTLTAVPCPSSPEFIAIQIPTCSDTPQVGLSKPIVEDERKQLYEEIEKLRMEKANLLEENKRLSKRLKGAVHLYASNVEGNDRKCKFFTGISWDVFVKTFSFLVTFMKPTKIAEKLDLRDQFFITLVKLRLNLSFEYIGYATDLSTSQASEVFWRWIELVSTKLDFLIKWPDREVSRRTLPGPFRSLFPRLTCIIDCFEIVINRPKKLCAQSKVYSNDKRLSTVKVLIGCTPNGSISFLSKAWGGCVSDNDIVRQSGFVDPNMHHPHDQILADRGFTLKDDFAALCSAEIITPAFTKRKRQLSAKEVEESRQLSSVRIHIKRATGHMKGTFKILQGNLSISEIKTLTDEADELELSRIDKILISCAVFVNLGDGIVYQE